MRGAFIDRRDDYDAFMNVGKKEIHRKYNKTKYSSTAKNKKYSPGEELEPLTDNRPLPTTKASIDNKSEGHCAPVVGDNGRVSAHAFSTCLKPLVLYLSANLPSSTAKNKKYSPGEELEPLTDNRPLPTTKASIDNKSEGHCGRKVKRIGVQGNSLYWKETEEAGHLVEKLNALGYKAIVFIGKKLKKQDTWSAQVLHPKWQLSEHSEKCLDRMKALCEVLINAKCVRLFKILLHSQHKKKCGTDTAVTVGNFRDTAVTGQTTVGQE
ncbi:hypothetical protein D9C73_000850 [Collichthys lucidus]|uniref:Uncharacterized protein n=1 Tax=Collichthys lucidus TaxID=240159 RepID=A0A4U5U1A2_COLLU|nr:hypothetical protein D9C73_000850 [Collichthys lucidus]